MNDLKNFLARKRVFFSICKWLYIFIQIFIQIINRSKYKEIVCINILSLVHDLDHFLLIKTIKTMIITQIALILVKNANFKYHCEHAFVKRSVGRIDPKFVTATFLTFKLQTTDPKACLYWLRTTFRELCPGQAFRSVVVHMQQELIFVKKISVYSAPSKQYMD